MKLRRSHVLAFSGNRDTPEQQGHPSSTVGCGEQACVSQAGKQKNTISEKLSTKRVHTTLITVNR